MAKQGLPPRFNTNREIPTFEGVAQQVHIERLPTWKNATHGQQWINTPRNYAFPKIERMPIDSIGQPEVLMCLSPIWTEKHETARRLSQRIKTVLDVAKSKGFRSGENPVTTIKDANVLPKITKKPKGCKAMAWQDVPVFYEELKARNAMAAKALMFKRAGLRRACEPRTKIRKATTKHNTFLKELKLPTEVVLGHLDRE